MTTIAENILDLVRGEPGITTPIIRSRLGIPAGTATGRTSELVKRGALRREGRALFFERGLSKKVGKIHYELLIDSSGSMAGFVNGKRKDHSAFELVRAQVEAIGEEPIIYNFEGRRTLQEAAACNGFGTMLGHTPLFGGTVAAIKRAQRFSDAPKVVLIFTDGMATDSNALNEFKAALASAEKDGDVTVAFLVPEGTEGWQQLLDAGVPVGNIRPWKTVEEASKDAVEAVHKFKREVARGARRSKHYFTADLSRVTAADLADLTEISPRTRRWTVERETDIETLISEKTKQPYVPGTGYFEVMKREGRIVLDPKSKRTYSDGKRTVKDLCGYPAQGDFAVKPGNHAGLVVLCQSKSSAKDTYRARILPRGTNVVLWPGS
jgi:DNA-binding Lrp family transcriptional regulator